MWGIFVGNFGGRGCISANRKEVVFRKFGVPESEVDLCWILSIDWNSIVVFSLWRRVEFWGET